MFASIISPKKGDNSLKSSPFICYSPKPIYCLLLIFYKPSISNSTIIRPILCSLKDNIYKSEDKLLFLLFLHLRKKKRSGKSALPATISGKTASRIRLFRMFPNILGLVLITFSQTHFQAQISMSHRAVPSPSPSGLCK